ncbi:hypothetical protein QMK19_26045 [Streptomyces sp. H10-C2]|uniref:hypothetical protein n=1 Tax=unclassified Streptomyces TaxID=2593676 RepID=UPI0024BA5D67|nr:MULTISPECIES: hypothetical protein [unclassified Streptomyces]MDJ0345659.1 hypothetical protein [Streptomyces sp. PH10-H1]MDJ0373024.1 hypothetical protein [Streptomyces sp. H10-C2]
MTENPSTTSAVCAVVISWWRERAPQSRALCGPSSGGMSNFSAHSAAACCSTFGLGLPLEDPGFDASVLSEFRTRLTGDGQADRLLRLLLRHLREHRLLDKGGRQRTDATHVHAAVRLLNRLELAMETMRAALETLAIAAPVWLLEHAPAVWWDRYAQRADDYRLPQPGSAHFASHSPHRE